MRNYHIFYRAVFLWNSALESDFLQENRASSLGGCSADLFITFQEVVENSLKEKGRAFSIKCPKINWPVACSLKQTNTNSTQLACRGRRFWFLSVSLHSLRYLLFSFDKYFMTAADKSGARQSLCPTVNFPNSEHQNPPILGQSTNFGALKLWNVRSGDSSSCFGYSRKCIDELLRKKKAGLDRSMIKWIMTSGPWFSDPKARYRHIL